MERVVTLSERLQEQIKNNVTIDELLITVQMLQSELQHLRNQDESNLLSAGYAIHIPAQVEEMHNSAESKTTVTLDIDEDELHAELEAIKKIAESKNILSFKNRRPFYFDPVEDTPTLSHQTQSTETNEISDTRKEVDALPIEEKESVVEQVNSTVNVEPKANPVVAEINDSLKSVKKEVSDVLKDTPIKDLKKGIGINDRFLFINDLFKGDESMYERSIKTINGFSIFPEAEYWIRRELKTKLGWNDQDDVVRQFDALVKRRFL
ncbi:MAG: hypothetical protein RL582_349 [Bacteroidota bacterium]|jgi:hypothetical protein